MSSQAEPDVELEKPTDASSLMVELMDLRRRMVRDLEQFLSVELSRAGAWIRWVPCVVRGESAPQAGLLNVGDESVGVRLIQFARSEYQPCC